MDIQEAFRPDIYQALCDSDTDKNSSKKRIRKAVESTLNYLDRCLDIHVRSDVISLSVSHIDFLFVYHFIYSYIYLEIT